MNCFDPQASTSPSTKASTRPSPGRRDRAEIGQHSQIVCQSEVIYLGRWHVGIRDKQQRLFLVFVGTDRVAIVNGDPDSRPAVASFNAAGAFHHYRLVVDDELAMLFVDGSKQPIVSKPVGRPESGEDQANLVYFGDGKLRGAPGGHGGPRRAPQVGVDDDSGGVDDVA